MAKPSYLTANSLPTITPFTPHQSGPIIRNMSEDISEFIPDWLQTYLDNLPENERKNFLLKYEHAVHQALKQLEDIPLNIQTDGTEMGRLNVRFGHSDVFFNVKNSLWTAVKYVGPVMLAVAVSPALLAHLGITAAMMPHATVASTASAVAALRGAFQKLDPAELDTYQATAAAIERNRNRVLANSGADLREVEATFNLDRDLVPPTDLKATLDQLVAKQVLKFAVIGGVGQYFLTF
jgi:hypothetical protein